MKAQARLMVRIGDNLVPAFRYDLVVLSHILPRMAIDPYGFLFSFPPGARRQVSLELTRPDGSTEVIVLEDCPSVVDAYLSGLASGEEGGD